MNLFNETESAKLLVILSERGVDYPSGSKAIAFRDKLFVRKRGERRVDMFALPLPMSAEVCDDYPLDQTPFSSKFTPDFNIPKTCSEATEIITSLDTMGMLNEMDQKFIGSKNYMGLAYFWAYDYRHTLRDCNVASRVAVHAAWLANELALDGVSAKHETVMRLALKQVADALKGGN